MERTLTRPCVLRENVQDQRRAVKYFDVFAERLFYLSLLVGCKLVVKDDHVEQKPGPLTDEEIDTAKRQLEIDQIYEAERPSQLVHTLGYWWAVADLDYYTDYAARVRAVTRADLHDFASRYLVGRPRVTGLLVAPEHRRLLGPLGEERDG